MGEGVILRDFLLFIFSHRLLAILRWDLHFLRVRIWNVITFKKRRIQRALSSYKKPLYLNLGSGPRGIEDAHWLNVDGFRDCNVHYLLDFSRPLPFPNETFDGVFCEHVLEHFSLDEGQRLVQEVYRILTVGGCLRIVVPDAELILRRYIDAPDELVAHRTSGNETPMEIVNSYFRQRYEHQFLYDEASMKAMLLRSGFNKLSRVSFGSGKCCDAIILDNGKYEWESLYIEAVK